MLGIKYPFMQGAMANISKGSFAADVSNAGSLGIIASGGMSASQLQDEIKICREKTDKPFGVNVMLMAPNVDEIAKLLADERIAVITTGAGSCSQFVPMWKESGAKVIPVVAAGIQAKRLERVGADAIVAEGMESGGHVGELTTMALVPQVCAEVKIPVIAAGGIASGRQLAAAFALGAIGAQIGTCLLVSEECPIHDNFKQMIINAKDNDTVVTGRSKGAPVRVLKNKMTREYLRMEKEDISREELEKLTLGSLRKAVVDGNVDEGSFMAGQVASHLNEIRPLKDIFESLYVGYQNCLKEMVGLK